MTDKLLLEKFHSKTQKLLSPKRYRDDSINATYFNTIDSYSSLE